MNWVTVVILVMVLVAIDKSVTVANIKSVEKNHPGTDPLSIEKNPVAKWFFKNSGLLMGPILFAIISIAINLLGVYFLSQSLRLFTANNEGIAIYIYMMIYAVVIFNNLYFYLKYNQLI